ncbi:MAG: hypothetical protein MJE77_00685 [Proteobacteria bacterium]|nr:hypothetical protein [Pseudomonadota bacterium]
MSRFNPPDDRLQGCRHAGRVSRGGLAIAAVLGCAALCLSSCSASSTANNSSKPKAFTVFMTTELRGTIEPCGCNSDPLGDIARTTELITRTRQNGRDVLVLDGGSLLYSEVRVPDYLKAQEALKSSLIETIYREQLRASAIGLGPYDLGAGLAMVRPPRQVSNVASQSGLAVEPPKVVDAGGVKIGIFGVIAPAALVPFGIKASAPDQAALDAVASLRKKGARLIIGLAHMTRPEAAKLARAVSGIDFLLVGQKAPEPDQITRTAQRIGDTYLIAPANRGQVITRLDVTVRGTGPLSDAVGEARAAVEIAALGQRMAALNRDLAGWKSDPSADPDFVAAKERELVELEKRKTSLQAKPLQVPDKGSFFTLEQISIRKGLPCNGPVNEAKQAYDRAAGQANSKAAAGKKPPLPAPGKPGYAGVDECENCHDEAVEFWKKTRHFKAWETLEVRNKQFNYDCISCHVTGWDQPGGSNLAVNENLRDVQCEVCHGPGSIHVAEDGADEPATVVLVPPEALCVTCHNSEHSDTFDYRAYLRNVTGPGHGEEFRAQLGDGPTGRELRRAALEKAGKSIGAGCVK